MFCDHCENSTCENCDEKSWGGLPCPCGCGGNSF